MYLWQRVFRYNHIILLPCTCICLKCQREVLGKQMQPYTLVCPHTHTHTHTHTHSHRFIPARAKTSGLPDGWIVLGAPMCCFDCPRPPVPRNSLKNTISQQHLLGPGPYIAVSGDHTDTSNVCVCVCVCVRMKKRRNGSGKGKSLSLCVCSRVCICRSWWEREYVKPGRVQLFFHQHIWVFNISYNVLAKVLIHGKCCIVGNWPFIQCFC